MKLEGIEEKSQEKAWQEGLTRRAWFAFLEQCQEKDSGKEEEDIIAKAERAFMYAVGSKLYAPDQVVIDTAQKAYEHLPEAEQVG